MRVKDLSISFRPREKAKRYGITSLSDVELLALILCQGTSTTPVLELASSLIYSHPSLKELFEDDFIKLKSFKGIGEAQAYKLLAVFELANRREYDDITLNKDLMPIVKKYMSLTSTFNDEHGYLIGLDYQHNVILEKELFKGFGQFGFIDTKRIVDELNQSNSKEFILIHNHLNDAIPSDDDINTTLKIESELKKYHKRLIDHIIVAKNDFYSLKNVFKNY